MRPIRAMILSGILAASMACAGTDPEPSATVYFEIDAPLCSSVIPVEFLIDSVLVGTDTFYVNYGPPHHRSRAFETPPGTHRLGARFENHNYSWPDTIVSLEAGQAFTDSLYLYCS